MCTVFLNALRECLKQGGYAERRNDQEAAGTFLVGYGGRLFLIQEDYAVIESSLGADACGCGGQIALGSILSTKGMSLSPAARIELALSAAAQLSVGVSGPFHIIADPDHAKEAARV